MKKPILKQTFVFLLFIIFFFLSLDLGARLSLKLQIMLLKSSIYFAYILYFVICMLLKLSRVKLYLIMGIVYATCNLINYTDGQINISIYNFLYCFPHFPFLPFPTYEQFLIFLEYFVFIIKESMLTFIIFDVIFQYRESKEEKLINRDVNNILFLINYLSLLPKSAAVYKTRISPKFLNIDKRIKKDQNNTNLKEEKALIEQLASPHDNAQFLKTLQALSRHYR